MKPAALVFSTALASMMLLAPAVYTSAEAASVKFKPQIVKVKPRIVIAKPKVRVKIRAVKVRVKPKVRIKVRAAKVRVKPKVQIKAARIKSRIKVKSAMPKIAATVKIKPKLVVAPKTTLKTRLRVAGKISSNKLMAMKMPPVNNLGNANTRPPSSGKTLPYYPFVAHKLNLPKEVGPQRTVQRTAKLTSKGSNALLSPSPVQPSNRTAGNIQTGPVSVGDRQINLQGNQSGIKDAMQAALAADAMKDTLALGELRVAATPEMGLPTPDLGANGPKQNNDWLTPPDTGAGNLNHDSLWGQNEAGGFGPDSFVGLPNTHSRGPANSNGSAAGDAAKGFWGVTGGSIASIVAGVSGQRSGPVRMPLVKANGTDQIYSEWSGNTSYYVGGDSRETMRVKNRADGTATIIHSRFDDNDGDGNLEGEYQRVTEVDANGDVTEDTGTDSQPSSFNRHGTTQLRDPDSGYSGPSPFPWIEESKKADLSTVASGKTAGGLPAAPDQGQPTGWSSGSAMYSATDVLEAL